MPLANTARKLNVDRSVISLPDPAGYASGITGSESGDRDYSAGGTDPVSRLHRLC
jgi:hypothetical protein